MQFCSPGGLPVEKKIVVNKTLDGGKISLPEHKAEKRSPELTPPSADERKCTLFKFIGHPILRGHEDLDLRWADRFTRQVKKPYVVVLNFFLVEEKPEAEVVERLRREWGVTISVRWFYDTIQELRSLSMLTSYDRTEGRRSRQYLLSTETFPPAYAICALRKLHLKGKVKLGDIEE